MNIPAPRSALVTVATCLQGLLGLQALAAFAIAILSWGAFSPFGNDFSSTRVIHAGSVLCVPVVSIVASALLLVLRQKWGWYLTIAVNLLIDTLTSWVIIRKGVAWHISSWSYFLTYEQVLLLGPVILLYQPEARREFLSPGATRF